MRFAIVNDGIVVNTAEAEQQFGNSVGWIECTANVGIGWTYVNGVFIEPIDTTSNEEKSLLIRTERNKILFDSDWTQVADAPVDQAAWATYRQALRDVPAQEGFPNTVDWPTQP